MKFTVKRKLFANPNSRGNNNNSRNNNNSKNNNTSRNNNTPRNNTPSNKVVKDTTKAASGKDTRLLYGKLLKLKDPLLMGTCIAGLATLGAGGIYALNKNLENKKLQKSNKEVREKFITNKKEG